MSDSDSDTRTPTELDAVTEEADVDTVALVDQLLDDAVSDGASDVHFDPYDQGGGVRYRIDGVFHEQRTLPEELYLRCLGRLKLLGGVTAYRQDVPQDGRIDRPAADLRLSVVPTPFGEKAVVRIFQTDRMALAVADLGLSASARARLESLLGLGQGAVLVTGPCSSGKTTTLYALLRRILAARRDHAHVVTLEDPVECRLPGVTQLEVDPERGVDFAAGLRALLRQDPEVLLVGEIRDPETAQIAVEAAFTGHLVLSSLHAGTPAEAVARLAQMEVAPYLLASAVAAVVNQRLLRRLCAKCGAAGGCPACRGTGYHGRMAVAEVRRIDDRVRPLVLARAATADLARLWSDDDTLSGDAERAVAAGVTTPAEVVRVLGDLALRGGREEPS